MAQRLKGIEVVRAMQPELLQASETLQAKGVQPCLCVIRAGDREDDVAYAAGIAKRCEQVGVAVRSVTMPLASTTAQVLEAVEAANADRTVHGVLIMRPLPKQVDDRAVCAALDPAKDMDGITDASMAKLYAGAADVYAPCTAEACIALLDYYGIEVKGKNVAVIGRSLVIGKPVAMLLIQRHATVTVCHTRTIGMQEICKRADLVIAAAGVAGMVDASYVRQGQTVLDVGINVDADGNLCGDVDFGAVEPIVDAITPVPGGVGTVTSAILAKHVIRAATQQTEAEHQSVH